MNLTDLIKSFPMSIWLRNLACLLACFVSSPRLACFDTAENRASGASDLNISAKFRRFFLRFQNFNTRNAKKFDFASNFVAIFADINEIWSDFFKFLEKAEKRCNSSKCLDFNLILS